MTNPDHYVASSARQALPAPADGVAAPLADPALFDWLGRFESLGANCEFGFVLNRCGIGGSALFRWAELFSIRRLATLIRQDFAGIYDWDKLRPFNAGMIRDDGCEVCWHSLIRSEPIDPAGPLVETNFRFHTPEPERRRIWAIERKRMTLLVRKLRADLAEGRKIFVHRVSAYDVFATADVLDLFDALRRHGPNRLLVVTACGRGEQAEAVEQLRPGLLHGRVDRFAPGSKADDVSLRSWLYLCRAALSAFVS